MPTKKTLKLWKVEVQFRDKGPMLTAKQTQRVRAAVNKALKNVSSLTRPGIPWMRVLPWQPSPKKATAGKK